MASGERTVVVQDPLSPVLDGRAVEKTGIQGAVNARVATAAMAANEFLARPEEKGDKKRGT
jgi:hypothetical protein